MKVPSAGGSVEAIFSLSCDPERMKIVISDPKTPPVNWRRSGMKIFFFEKMSFLAHKTIKNALVWRVYGLGSSLELFFTA